MQTEAKLLLKFQPTPHIQGKQMNAEIFKSKRFWVAVAGIVAVVFEDKIPIEKAQLEQIILLVATWIVGDSLRAVPPPATK